MCINNNQNQNSFPCIYNRNRDSFINADNFHCGGQGTLTRMHDANHMLDLRCLPIQPCPAGGMLGICDAREGMARGYNWLEGL